jgi:arsenite methyltransferase
MPAAAPDDGGPPCPEGAGAERAGVDARLGAPKRSLMLSRSALLTGMLLAGVGCPVMHERDGHRVFNPVYTFALEGDDREEWQRPEELMDALQIGPGSRVADVGAGSGWFTERLARRVGPSGVIYASDVQPEMISKLRERVAQLELANVRIIEARYEDARLPPAASDVVVFLHVYKEISERVPYMKRVLPALAPGARVAIVEFEPDAGGRGPPRKYRLARTTVISELEHAGYRLVQEHDFLPRQYFLVFAPKG